MLCRLLHALPREFCSATKNFLETVLVTAACRGGKPLVINWLLGQLQQHKELQPYQYHYWFRTACNAGHEEAAATIFAWCPSWPNKMKDLFLDVAREGHVGVIKLLHEKFKLNKRNDSDCIGDAVELASSGGHRDLVTFLCTTFDLSAWDTHEAFRTACEKGRLNVVKYLHERTAFAAVGVLKHHIDALRAAVKNKHLSVVKFLCKRLHLTADHVKTNGYIVLTEALKTMSLDMIRYLHTQLQLQSIDWYDLFDYELINSRFLSGRQLCLRNTTIKTRTGWHSNREFGQFLRTEVFV